MGQICVKAKEKSELYVLKKDKHGANV